MSRWLGREIVRLESAASTNDVALARAREGARPGLVVLADAQTRGRGRLGRAWHSPPGQSLYLSALCPPPASIREAPSMTLAAGVAVHDTLNAAGCRTSIKWPNDVLASGKKVAGILTETTTRGDRLEAVVIGVGVNVNVEAFPAELAPIATSMRLELGRPIDREPLCAQLLADLERWLDLHRAEGAAPIVRAWKDRSQIFGREVRVLHGGEPVVGEARDLDGEGALLVRVAGRGELRVLAGEVIIT